MCAMYICHHYHIPCPPGGHWWDYQTDTLSSCLSHCSSFNSLARGKFEWNFRHVIFKQILVIDGWGISCEIVLIWMSLDFTDDQATLIQVMAWCCQATNHCLSQCWPRSLSPYDVTRPQWVKNWVSVDFIYYDRVMIHDFRAHGPLIGLGNLFLSDGTKPLLEPILAYLQWVLVILNWL